MADAALALRGLVKRYGATTAVAGLDLDVAPGEFVTLLGPSGCGKTTTLNLIAGFTAPDAGSIVIEGSPVENLPPHRRDLGVVFQDYALFPHMSVADNVGFGLRMRGVDAPSIARRVEEALAMVRLPGLAGRRPGQLSGGQRQRVALARALVIRPRMLLLDEPLSNLDLKLREEMRLEISRLQRELGIATVFVTHDQGEALAMSDRIAVMNAGRIEQIGTPEAIYERPRTRFVAGFVGRINVLDATVEAADAVGRVRVLTAAGPLLASTDERSAPGARAVVAFRPERVTLAATAGPAEPGTNRLQATIAQVVYQGARTEFRLALDGAPPIWVDAPNDRAHARFAAGTAVDALVAAADCRLLPEGDP